MDSFLLGCAVSMLGGILFSFFRGLNNPLQIEGRLTDDALIECNRTQFNKQKTTLKALEQLEQDLKSSSITQERYELLKNRQEKRLNRITAQLGGYSDLEQKIDEELFNRRGRPLPESEFTGLAHLISSDPTIKDRICPLESSTPTVCPACAHQMIPEALFCHLCGIDLLDSGPCQSCGTSLPGQALYCSECGTRREDSNE